MNNDNFQSDKMGYARNYKNSQHHQLFFSTGQGQNQENSSVSIVFVKAQH